MKKQQRLRIAQPLLVFRQLYDYFTTVAVSVATVLASTVAYQVGKEACIPCKS